MFESIVQIFPIYLADSILSGIYGIDLLKPRIQKRLLLVLWTILYFVMSVVVYEVFGAKRGVLGIGINILAVFLMQCLFFRINYMRQMFVSFSFIAGKDVLKYIISVLNYSVSNRTWSYVERLINNDNQISVAKANAFVDGYLIILSVLNIAVYTSLFYVYLKFIEKKYVHRGYEPSLWENIFLIFPCITALCISVTLRLLIVKMEEGTATIAYDTMPVARFWIVVICIFLLVSIILTMMLFQYLIERNEDNRKQAILEKQVEQLHREIEDIEEIYTDLRGLKHDMRNHMNNIMQYVKSTGNENVREIDSYISQMEDVVDRLDFSAKSGNPITDIIIYQRQQEARKHDIIFDVEFVAPDTEQIDIYDIAVIMNNALENAFEACNELAGCREVSLRSYMKGALFFIEVENDFDGDITIDKETGLPMTSKKDKYLHGIGLYNLQKCARKYMGDVDIEIQSKDGRKRFLLTVMMNGKISLQK